MVLGAAVSGAAFGGILGLFIDNVDSYADASLLERYEDGDANIFVTRTSTAESKRQGMEDSYERASQNLGKTCLQILPPYLTTDATLQEMPQGIAMKSGNPCDENAVEVRSNIKPTVNAAQEQSRAPEINIYIQDNYALGVELKSKQDANNPCDIALGLAIALGTVGAIGTAPLLNEDGQS